MKKYLTLLFLTFSLWVSSLHGQTEEDFEFFVIDSYITPEKPYMFNLVFSTSDSAKTQIIFNGNKVYDVSRHFTEDHKFTLNVSGMKFDSSFVPFVLIAVDRMGRRHRSEVYEAELPNDKELIGENTGGSFFNICLGGTMLLIPSVSFFPDGDGSFKYSLSKELPFISFSNIGAKYPHGYVAFEYSYVFGDNPKNIFRLNYKHIFPLGFIEYFSPGISFFTDFKGNSGLAPSISVGLFRVKDDMSFYLEHRYNLSTDGVWGNFNEIQLGFYAPFFTINY